MVVLQVRGCCYGPFSHPLSLCKLSGEGVGCLTGEIDA